MGCEDVLLLLTEAKELCNNFFEECDLNDLQNVKELLQDYSNKNPFVAEKILKELINQDKPEAVSAALETGIYSDTDFFTMRDTYIPKACTPSSYKNSLIPLIEYCNELGFSVQDKEDLFKVPLHRAVKTNSYELASFIFNQGVYNDCNKDQVDFLYKYLNDAIKSGYVDMAYLLLEYVDFANRPLVEVRDAGLAAIEQQNPDLLSLVFGQVKSYFFEHSISFANSMLSGAVMKKNTDLLEFALAHGADPCSVNFRTFTCVSMGRLLKVLPVYTDVTVTLLEHGADPCYPREDITLDPELLGQVFNDG